MIAHPQGHVGPQPKNHARSGFTLVELLIVIAILGVLASLILANMSGARERARDTQRKSDLRQLQTALRMYFNDYMKYPGFYVSGGVSRIQHIATDGSVTTFNWGDEFALNGNTYMAKLPQDPLSTSIYQYNYWRDSSDTDVYCAWANLENTSDPQIADSQERCDACASLLTGEATYVVCNE